MAFRLNYDKIATSQLEGDSKLSQGDYFKMKLGGQARNAWDVAGYRHLGDLFCGDCALDKSNPILVSELLEGYADTDCDLDECYFCFKVLV